MSTRAPTVSPADEMPTARIRAHSNFFFGMSVLLLTLVLVGFAPTLYLRAFFDVPPIRAHLYVHGVIVTSWFIWLLVQTTLVKTRRMADHRRFGVIGAALGLATIGAGVHATLKAPSGITAAGLSFDADISAIGTEGLGTGVPIIAGLSGSVWGNLGSALAFFILVAAAILLRARPDSHKRLMLLASITIMAPALARVSRLPMLGGEQGPFVPMVLVGLLLTLIGYDLLSTRRIQRATLLGGGLAVLCIAGGLMISTTEWARAVVRALG